MKQRTPFFSVLFASLLLVHSAGHAQDDIGKGITNLKAKSHPYLLFTNSRVQQLKERIQKDTLLANAWMRLKDKLDTDLQTNRSGNLESLCLAYRMTGEDKYASSAKKLLLQLVNKEAWDGMDDRTPRWNSGLATARGNFSAAVSFDALYEYLSKEDRAMIAHKIIQLGIEPSLGDWISSDKRLHSLNSMGHNWWSAVVYEAGMASLAVMNEEPKAKQWAVDVMQASSEWFFFSGSTLENKIPSFDARGGFYESISYANFALSEYLLFRLAWSNCFRAIQMPYDELLKKTMNWFINGSYPNDGPLLSLNFGDSNPLANGERSVKLMMALGFGNNSDKWYLSETVKGHFAEDMNINTPLGLLYAPEIINTPNAPLLSPSALYADIGWGMLRSSWDKNATLLGVKSGYTWNHSHADAGSFVLYHRGKNLLIDGGDVNYALPEYSNYFVRSEAHNVMLFNGKAQNPEDEYSAVKNPAHLYHLIDGGNIKYVLADAQGPTAEYFARNYRNFLWIGNVILVIDDVKSHEAGKFEWLLHYDQTAVKKGIDLEIKNDTAAILVRPLFPETLPSGYFQDFPEKMRLEEKWGYKDHDVKTKVPYYSISPAEISRQQKFITAIILLNENNKSKDAFTGSSGAQGTAAYSNLPVIEKLEGQNMIGVRITQDGKKTDVYFNLLADGRLMHRNSNVVINGWETDAYLFAVTYPQNKEASNPSNAIEYFIGNGSYLRKEKTAVINSLSKVFGYVNNEADKSKLILEGQPVMHIGLTLPNKPVSILVNGKPEPLQNGPGNSIIVNTNNYSSFFNDREKE